MQTGSQQLWTFETDEWNDFGVEGCKLSRTWSLRFRCQFPACTATSPLRLYLSLFLSLFFSLLLSSPLSLSLCISLLSSLKRRCVFSGQACGKRAEIQCATKAEETGIARATGRPGCFQLWTLCTQRDAFSGKIRYEIAAVTWPIRNRNLYLLWK